MQALDCFLPELLPMGVPAYFDLDPGLYYRLGESPAHGYPLIMEGEVKDRARRVLCEPVAIFDRILEDRAIEMLWRAALSNARVPEDTLATWFESQDLDYQGSRIAYKGCELAVATPETLGRYIMSDNVQDTPAARNLLLFNLKGVVRIGDTVEVINARPTLWDKLGDDL
jgi:hypothetical protein